MTSVVWSRSTASFSAAIASTVSPSHSVCSSPIEVSTVAFDGRTLVASSRPPSPASITANSTLASARATNAVAVAASNCEIASPGSSVRWTPSTAAAVRSAAEANASVPISSPAIVHPLRPALEMGREVGAAAMAVSLDQRRRHLGHRRLPVRADDVDGREAVLGHPERRDELAHALEPEAHPERVERVEPGLGVERHRCPGAQSAELGELGAVALELLALGVDDARPAPWRRSPRWRACPRRGRSRREAARGARRGGAPPPRRRPRPTAGSRRRRSSSAARRRRRLAVDRDPREPRDELRRLPRGARAASVAPAGTRFSSRQRADPADELDRAVELGLGLAVAQAGVGVRERAVISSSGRSDGIASRR